MAKHDENNPAGGANTPAVDRSEPEEAASPPELTAEERAAIAAWPAPTPPPGFAAAVVAKHLASEARHEKTGRGRAAGAIAAALLVAVGAAALFSRTTEPLEGRHVASERSTVTIGDRAVLVAEAGSDLSWSTESDGSLAVRQERGDVFYRVDKGGPFLVRTPAGTVRVLGTCFRVELEDESMKNVKAGALGAVTGAAAATIALVTVYEGKVMTASARGELPVSAGQVAELGADVAPALVGSGARGAAARPRPRDGVAGSAHAARTPASSSVAAGIEVPVRALVKEAEELRVRVAELEDELEKVKSERDKKAKVFDLEPEQLLELAERCELRWDMPSYSSTPPQTNEKDLEKVGLKASDKKAIEAALAKHHEQFTKELAAIYTEVTGDDYAGGISPWAMISEIEDKSNRDEVRRVFQKIARERAGLETPPANVAGLPAIERLFRLMTTAGDTAERAIAEKIGATQAHALRGLNDGWGNRSRSSHGCPGE